MSVGKRHFRHAPSAAPLRAGRYAVAASLGLMFAAFGTTFQVPLARADAVPPPPSFCMPGKTAITSHSGPECVENAPDDCPTGWYGLLGGKCSLRPCKNDSGCQTGESCVEHAMCVQPFEDQFYDYGEEESEKQGLLELPSPKLFQSRALLAGPPMPRTRRPKPIVRYNAINLCAPEVPCVAPSTCQPEKVCVPQGKRALAYRGDNIQPVRSALKTDTPLTVSKAAPTEVFASKGTGCAGCGFHEKSDDPWALALVFGVFVLAARRRG